MAGPALQRETGHACRQQWFALRSRDIAAETMGFDEELVDELATNQVLLDDPFEHRWIAGAIPRAFRVHDGDRSAFADPQAVGLRTKNAALLRQPQLLQTPLEIV